MSEDKSKLELIGEIAQANNKNLELIEEINQLRQVLDEIREYIKSHINYEKNSDGYGEPYLGGYEIRDLLEILDKVKEYE